MGRLHRLNGGPLCLLVIGFTERMIDRYMAFGIGKVEARLINCASRTPHTQGSAELFGASKTFVVAVID